MAILRAAAIPLLLSLASPDLRAQGCVATGSSGLMLGGAGHGSCLADASDSGGSDAQGPYLRAGGWQASLGYRWFTSHRHFVGATEQTRREDAGTEVVNHNTLLDLSLTRGLTRRVSVTAGLPFFVGTRWQTISKSGTVVGRNTTSAQSAGDFRLVADAWLGEPSSHRDQNVSLGLGLKFPTGHYNDTGTFRDAAGAATVRTLDQSMQSGDGRLGVIVQGQAFKFASRRLMLFANGTYLVTPYATNGVATFRSRPSEGIMSVADQYLAQAGASYAVLPRHGLAASVAGRLEGIPVRDLVGSSEGFRRPGLIVSVEPGLVFSRKWYTMTLSAPVALHRERQRSVPDMQDGAFGDAAFADYSILVGQSVRF